MLLAARLGKESRFARLVVFTLSFLVSSHHALATVEYQTPIKASDCSVVHNEDCKPPALTVGLTDLSA